MSTTVHTTRAAVEEGIVPGGGVALLRAARALDDLHLEGDQQVGVDLLRRAVEEPLRCIAANAGHPGTIVVEKVRGLADDWGWNAVSGTYEDLVAAGIVDPTKVVRFALLNATSIASLLLTTEVWMGDEPEPARSGAAATGSLE